jgi:hypothetical protein
MYLKLMLLFMEVGSLIVYYKDIALGNPPREFYWKDKKVNKYHGPFPSAHHALSHYRQELVKLRKSRVNTTVYVDFKNKKRIISEHTRRDS